MKEDWRPNRRSVKKDIPDWPGWDEFMGLYKACDNAKYPEDSRLYFEVLFETGCRESEAILLRPEQFKYNEEAIMVSRAPVDKKKRRVKTGRTLPDGEPEFKSVKQYETRDIFIKLENNPIAHNLIESIKKCDTEYVLAAKMPFSREVIRDQHTTRATVYNRISEIHPDIWPHGLRAYRASHLVYERDFDVQDLVAWFKWQSADVAVHYTQTKNMARKMGITKIPR